mmetsp:Transcript_50487/g.60735  ORF Transcript_50487/g.60735 Transcript_50487/m.60735 type:complete len:218 (+) Transcript_50487:218-871(+)
MLHPKNHSERIFRTITTNHQYKMENMRKRFRSNSNSIPFDSPKHTYLNGMETHARLLDEDGSADKKLFDEPNGSNDMASRSKPKSGEAAIGTGVSKLHPKNGVIHTIRSILTINDHNSNGHHTIERELNHLKKPPTRRPTKRPRPTVTPTKTPREKRSTRRPKPTAAPTLMFFLKRACNSGTPNTHILFLVSLTPQRSTHPCPTPLRHPERTACYSI